MCKKELPALQSLIFQSHKFSEVTHEIKLTQVISARKMFVCLLQLPDPVIFPNQLP